MNRRTSHREHGGGDHGGEDHGGTERNAVNEHSGSLSRHAAIEGAFADMASGVEVRKLPPPIR
jgi:hypothetical protein